MLGAELPALFAAADFRSTLTFGSSGTAFPDAAPARVLETGTLHPEIGVTGDLRDSGLYFDCFCRSTRIQFLDVVSAIARKIPRTSSRIRCFFRGSSGVQVCMTLDTSGFLLDFSL